MKVMFKAGIKSINTKQLVSMDNSTRLTIEKDSMKPDQLALLNAMLGSFSNKSQELTITIDDGIDQ